MSHSRILRSTSIIGSASLINILAGLLRQKVAAILLGATGVGLIGLYQNLVAVGSTLSALGFPNAGTREIAAAEASGDENARAGARRALFWGTLALALAGTIVTWLLREPIAHMVLGNAEHASAVAWLSIGVGLGVAASGQVALLTGLQRVGDVARVSIGSAMLAALIGVAAIAAFDGRGIVLFVIAVPLGGALTGFYFARRAPPVTAPKSRASDFGHHWRRMLPLGMAMMIGGVAGVAAQLAVRILVQREAGLDGAGYFHAAATLSLTYLGFLISAMSTDYFPRLSALAGDPNKAAELVNDQAEVALLLSGPIILLMLGAAPWVLQLLYAGEFRPAAPLLRWQLLGDVFRVASWPLAYLLLANGRGRRFLFAELTPPVLLIAVTAALLPSLGLVAAGIGVFVSYVAYFGVIHLLTARGEAFRWSAPALRALALLVVSSVLVFLAGEQDSRAGLGVAVAASFLLVIFGLKRLRPAFSELLRRG